MKLDCGLDLGQMDWAAVHQEAAAQSQLQPLRKVKTSDATVQDYGDVCLIEDDGSLVVPGSPPQVDFVRVWELFRTKHPDAYDTFVLVSDVASGLTAVGPSFFSHICNDVQGIGLPMVERSEVWNSTRLGGFIHLSHGNMGSGTRRHTLLHEFAHRWCCYAKYKDPETGEVMDDHLLNGWAHWSEALDNGRSPLGYDTFDWREFPTGAFDKQDFGSELARYSNLDLYLMGLLPAEAVGEFTVLRKVEKLPNGSFDAVPIRLTVQDFIAVEGERSLNLVRMPDGLSTSAAAASAQAWIVITKDRHRAHDLVQIVDDVRYLWTQDFVYGTKGLGSISTSLR